MPTDTSTLSSLPSKPGDHNATQPLSVFLPHHGPYACQFLARNLQHKVVWTTPGTIDIPGLCFEHRRKSMSTQRFTPEFKAEAVRQVIKRG
ncbi:hypothetical protein ACSEOG_29555, partial [Pseudomonas paraeruginosa]